MLGVINVTDCVFSEHKNMLKNLTCIQSDTYVTDILMST